MEGSAKFNEMWMEDQTFVKELKKLTSMHLINLSYSNYRSLHIFEQKRKREYMKSPNEFNQAQMEVQAKVVQCIAIQIGSKSVGRPTGSLSSESDVSIPVFYSSNLFFNTGLPFFVIEIVNSACFIQLTSEMAYSTFSCASFRNKMVQND